MIVELCWPYVTAIYDGTAVMYVDDIWDIPNRIEYVAKVCYRSPQLPHSVYAKLKLLQKITHLF